jgi:hypothetical protein
MKKGDANVRKRTVIIRSRGLSCQPDLGLLPGAWVNSKTIAARGDRVQSVETAYLLIVW